MIGDILSEIRDAEDKAAKIIEAATVKVAQIEKEATDKIQKINEKTQDEIAKINLKNTYQQPIIEVEEIKIEVSKEKLERAKKFIMDEFYKRYAH